MLNKKHIVIFLGDEKHMNKNIKRIFFVATLLILLFAIGTASASDVSDDTTIASDNANTVVATDADTTNSISNDNIVTDTATKDDNKNLEISDVEKQQKSENDENNIPSVNNEKNLKNDGEPTVIDITQDNFSTYFRQPASSNTRYIFNPGSDIIANLYYVPPTATEIDFTFSKPIDDYEWTIIGNNLTIKNCIIKVQMSRVSLSDITFIYDEEFSQSQSVISITPKSSSNGHYTILDNITIKANIEYNTDQYAFMVVSKQNVGNVTIKNSFFNVSLPSASNSYAFIDVRETKDTRFINNIINIQEIYGVGDNPSLIGFGVRSGYSPANLIFEDNNITMTGEKGNMYVIKMDTSCTQITNNNIITTSIASNPVIELTGNNNTVTDNKILANNKTGNDAVTATGENNVVENNTAAEFDTRIPTNIELNYDSTPIDVGQRLVIRGIFTAKGEDASAEGIKVYDNEEELTSINADEDGTITYAYIPTVAGVHNLTFKFEGNETHKETESTISITANEHIKEYTIQVDTTEFTTGTTTTISASIYADDEKATDINKGKVTFKVKCDKQFSSPL